MAKKKEETKTSQIDVLASDVLSVINKKFKEFPNAMGFLSNANLVTHWNSTGADMLDLAISNRPNGGIGFGVVTEISGLPGAGKSLIAAHILSECQKMGGLAVLFDTEKAIGMLEFYCSLGLDPDRVVYTDKLRALEEIYATIETIIEKAIAVNPDRPLTIVVDSVMGASTLKELEADYEKDGYATSKAIINSKAMRKIPSLIVGRKIAIVLINQLRANMNAMAFSDPFTTSGGNGIPFAASTRLRVKAMGKIKGQINGVDATIGERVEVTVVKNRLGPPKRKVTFDIRYDSGIDNYGSWLTMLKDLGCLRQSGAYYSYDYVDGETGEEITKRFQSKDFERLLTETPGLKQTIYEQICEAYIMKYDITNDLGIDDVTLEVGETFEEE